MPKNAFAGQAERLEEVWLVAGRHAAARGLNAYGVIVMLAPDGGWLVATDSKSLETEYTAGRCGTCCTRDAGSCRSGRWRSPPACSRR